ncbi:crotonyl-CoA carboxylase/reductase [Streptomyces sp. NBC_00878]|uniref:crotonyl-CoA carboxylase/reductase n=1 Tax=Streptomyces sp. NBC_00878 TaxID=2975854 RepID=UPI002259B201|nr:crotonyl-CoA carboxylase/reductase [Streptomyces sp. NBC_00878]MCX4902877.1 crotonyl-CoA carboxylase/reductase [Streptomyces sp. NBC_00878]
MASVTDAVLAGASPQDLERAALPEEFTAAHLRVEDVDVFQGVADKDVRKTLRVGPVPMPELAPDEVLVAVMASSINYNTVWSATFEPLSTFRFLGSYGRQGGWAERHDQPFHVLGSDAAGVVVRTGSAVRHWKTGDHVLVNAAVIDEQEAITQSDGMLGEHQLAWGYETNYGGIAHYCLARASQLIPKPAHLTWEEAASVPACAGTSYRMLVSDRGARMKQGDIVLIWGATGGTGAYAVQFVKNGGGTPVGVVGSARKAEALRALGCDVVIDRSELGLGEWDGDSDDEVAQAITDGKRLGRAIRDATGEDPHIVVDHVGQATFGMSVLAVRRGGTVITCGSSTGYRHRYDNRYLWMKLKRILGSHVANLHEQWECARLFGQGRVMPALSTLYPLDEVGEATRLVQLNEHIGKVGVLCLAPEPGLGVTDPELRARIGEERLNPLRPFATPGPGALAVTA